MALLGDLSRRRKKPEWVLRHLVLLKAHLPDAGCRTLALTFNRVFAYREVSVSKSFVHRTLREQAHAVWLARRAIRHVRPRAVPINHCWGIDLTGRKDSAGQLHAILGILDQRLSISAPLKWSIFKMKIAQLASINETQLQEKKDTPSTIRGSGQVRAMSSKR